MYIAQNKYLCLLRHIIMMHFGNGDKLNTFSPDIPWIFPNNCQISQHV